MVVEVSDAHHIAHWMRVFATARYRRSLLKCKKPQPQAASIYGERLATQHVPGLSQEKGEAAELDTLPGRLVSRGFG